MTWEGTNELRLEAIETSLKRLQEEAEALRRELNKENAPIVHLDAYPPNTVLRFTVEQRGKYYTYTALKEAGMWYVSDGSKIDSKKLYASYLKGAREILRADGYRDESRKLKGAVY